MRGGCRRILLPLGVWGGDPSKIFAIADGYIAYF
jgi:hypothetical protein